MAEQEESEQLNAMHRMVELAQERTDLSAARNYMAAERTLSVWTRTALALMAFGIALDRFGLFLVESTGGRHGLGSDLPSTWGGAGLVVFGIVMATLTAVRFQRYAAKYRENHTVPAHHGPFLAPAFAGIAALFGVALLVLLFLVS